MSPATRKRMAFARTVGGRQHEALKRSPKMPTKKKRQMGAAGRARIIAARGSRRRNTPVSVVHTGSSFINREHGCTRQHCDCCPPSAAEAEGTPNGLYERSMGVAASLETLRGPPDYLASVTDFRLQRALGHGDRPHSPCRITGSAHQAFKAPHHPHFRFHPHCSATE
jgi:hypothetical protein